MKRIWLLLFVVYLLATAGFWAFAFTFFAPPGLPLGFSLALLLGTLYMAASVWIYRKRILAGKPYPRSLRVFQIFYWTGTVGLVLYGTLAGSLLMADIVNKLVFTLVLSPLYAPLDLLSRAVVASRKRRAKLRAAP